MAGRRTDRYLLAAILMLPAIGGCEVMDTRADARRPARGAATFDLIRSVLTGGDALAQLKARGAKVDATFADAGQYPLEIPGLAERGSALSAKGTATTLTLVIPAAAGLTLADVTEQLGEATRLPAMPGVTWQYLVRHDHGRVGVALSSDPTIATSRVTKLNVIRER